MAAIEADASSSAIPKLALDAPDSLNPQIRRRIDYSFRVFCAVYGYRPVPRAEADGVFCYGGLARGPQDVALATGYRLRPLHQPLTAPVLIDLETVKGFPLFCAADGVPDWLGEAFEWLSGAHERAAQNLDEAERVPYELTIPGSFGLDPERPHAAIAFEELNRLLRQKLGEGWPAAPRSPAGASSKVLIASIHDVDFLPLSLKDVLHRLAKNLGIAVLIRRSPATAFAILRQALLDLGARRLPLDALRDMLERESAMGIGSTCAIICSQRHPRDANYRLTDPAALPWLQAIQAAGAELAVHGSYRSLESPDLLFEEYQALGEFGGEMPRGGRQHWLRFHGDALFKALDQCGAWYDASIGFSTRPGFRSGAAFPYPPYDFDHEQPFSHLELPLVVMDVALAHHYPKAEAAKLAAERVLDKVRTYGWGGVSVLWHDTVLSGCQIGSDHGAVYWSLPRATDQWMSGLALTRLVWARFANAGLLPADPPAAGHGHD